MYIARHVLFNEQVFPYQNSRSSTSGASVTTSAATTPITSAGLLHLPTQHLSSFGTSTRAGTSPRAGTFAALVPPPFSVKTNPSNTQPLVVPPNIFSPHHVSTLPPNPSNTPPAVDPPNISSPHLSTSSSSDVSHLIPPPSCHPMVTRSQNHICKPTLLPNGTPKYPLPHALNVSTNCPDVEPTCYSSAIKHTVWRDAMVEEFNALLKNGT